MNVDIETCREPGCDAPAGAGDSFELFGIDEHGRDAWFVHRRWTCAAGHRYVALEDVVPIRGGET